MDTYQSYLTHSAGAVLPFEEALQIYNDMAAGIAQCRSANEQETAILEEIVQDFFQRACSYAEIRAQWSFWSRERRQQEDAGRTGKHNVFIDSLNILCRLLNKEGIETPWREQLGDQRKRIGDFACFAAYITELNNR